MASHPETEKVIRKTLAHAGTIRNACQELLQALADEDYSKQITKVNTIETRVVLLVRDLGMAHHFQQEMKQ
jgi:hypothetical protein